MRIVAEIDSSDITRMVDIHMAIKAILDMLPEQTRVTSEP